MKLALKSQWQALHIKRISKCYSKNPFNPNENDHFYLVRKEQGFIVNYKLQFVVWKAVYNEDSLWKWKSQCSWNMMPPPFFIPANVAVIIRTTDKRTDVWSRDFIIWKINSGLWAVVWAGMWNKRVWANYEQLLKPVF